MKVSIIISDISRTGGTERSVVTLANMLSKKYASVEIVSLTKTKKEKSYYKLEDCVSVVFLKGKPIPLNILKKVRWALVTVSLLRTYFKANETDIIISTGHNNNWLTPFVKSNKQTKIIACEHIVYSSIPKVSRLFMSLTYRFFDQIVVLSEKAQESFVNYPMISVIPNAIPFDTKLKSQLTAKQILIVGRLSVEKGLERLIPIASKLKNKFPDWQIVLVGEGEERGVLERLIAEAKLVDFIILKGVTSDVQRYYLESSIYLMTSHFEAFPMVLLEAQNFGLPIIAFDCPEGPAQIISNGQNGYLIENGNTKDFVEKVSAMIENKKLREEFGKRAKANSLNFSEEKVMEQWASLIERLLD